MLYGIILIAVLLLVLIAYRIYKKIDNKRWEPVRDILRDAFDRMALDKFKSDGIDPITANRYLNWYPEYYTFRERGVEPYTAIRYLNDYFIALGITIDYRGIEVQEDVIDSIINRSI